MPVVDNYNLVIFQIKCIKLNSISSRTSKCIIQFLFQHSTEKYFVYTLQRFQRNRLNKLLQFCYLQNTKTDSHNNILYSLQFSWLKALEIRGEGMVPNVYVIGKGIHAKKHEKLNLLLNNKNNFVIFFAIELYCRY